MSNSDEIRWKQRYENFSKAIALLGEALEARPIDEYSRLEQEGIVQRFEYTFELAWKTFKDKCSHVTPGRYVGAKDVENDGIPFEDKMGELTARLYEQFPKSPQLEAAIKKNLEVLGHGLS